MVVVSVACAVAVRVVGAAGVEEGDAEVAARSRLAMERCTRGDGVVAELLFWTWPFLLSSLRRESSRRNTLARNRTTQSGSRSFLVDSVACDVAVRVVGAAAGVEEYGVKSLLEADVPLSGAHEGPRTKRNCFYVHVQSFSHYSGVRAAGKLH